MTYQPSESQLQNYIQNKLSDSETEQLELWLADHPDVMEDLEMGVMFKQSILPKPFIKKSKKRPFVFMEFITSRKLVLFHFLAYGLVGLLALSFFNSLDQPLIGEGNFQIVSLSPLRGSGDNEFNPIAMINLDKKSKQLIIVVQLNFPDEGPFSIEIQNTDSKTIVFEISGLYPIGPGDLNISVPVQYIINGNYWIVVKENEKTLEKLPIKIEWRP